MKFIGILLLTWCIVGVYVNLTSPNGAWFRAIGFGIGAIGAIVVLKYNIETTKLKRQAKALEEEIRMLEGGVYDKQTKP